MKFHSKRYAVTAAMCVIACCSMVIAADEPQFKWAITLFGAFFSGLLCESIIPYESRGDK